MLRLILWSVRCTAYIDSACGSPQNTVGVDPMTRTKAAKAKAKAKAEYSAAFDESEQILNLFEGLSISSGKSGGATSLPELDRHLQQWHEREGISMTKFKEVIRQEAICLGNMKAYQNQNALKEALRADQSKIVSRKKAKQYKYVRQCLTIL